MTFEETDQRYYTKGQTLPTDQITKLASSITTAMQPPATAGTNPGTPAQTVIYPASPGITYTNFKDSSGNPITIPPSVSGDPVVFAYIAVTGAVSVPLYTPVPISLLQMPFTIVGDTDGFSFIDADGNIAIKISNTGNTYAVLPDYMKTVDYSALLTLLNNLAGVSQPVDNGGYFEVVDANGFIAAQVRPNGEFAAGSLRSNTGVVDFGSSEMAETTDNLVQFVDPNGFIGMSFGPTGLGSSAPIPTGLVYDINLVPSYGQSLSVGWTSKPPISTLQKYNALMFFGGIRPDEATDQTTAYTSFVPAVEAVSPDNLRGETPCSGMSDMLAQRLYDENKLSINNLSFQILCGAPGVGGQPIAALSKGGSYYAKLTTQITNGMSVSAALGKTFNMPCFLWTQGESDVSGGTTGSIYTTKLIQLLTDLDTDARAATGQANAVQCIMYQTTNANQYSVFNSNEIAKAQLALALSDTRFTMAGPTYHLPRSSDNIHLTASSSKILGAYYGFVFKKAFIDGQRWTPMHYLSSVKQGQIVQLKFFAPVLPLVLDTTTVSNPGNFGFRAFDSGGTELTISSVTLSRADTIKIVIASGTATKITYALNGSTTTDIARGNVRDSQGEQITFDPTGINYKLHNWLPISEINI